MLSTTAAYLSVNNNLTRQQAAVAATTAVKSATDYYVANIGKVKTAADFIGNYRLFSYAMTAYGLGDKVSAKGLMTKVLDGGVTSSSALANTLSDPRYKAFATAFDFAGKGSAATSAASATTGTTAKYVEQTLETNEAKQNNGVALALYFKRNASSITSAYGLLGDSKMLTVVQTAFGISPTTGETDIDTQAAYLNKVLNIKNLQDPTKVEKLIERFTSQYDASSSSNISNVLLLDSSSNGLSADVLDSINGVAPAASDSILSLFNSSSTSSGVSSDLLLSLAKLQMGGS